MIENFLTSSKLQFEYYKSLGEKTMNQLSENELFWSYNEESNSIAIIINHLHGNMMSRWTDFLNSDGEKEWRNRDREFEDILKSREDVKNSWEDGWNCLFQALESIDENNAQQLIYIRNQGHTVIEALQRQLCHYAYHVGEIVYIGRMIKGKDWLSLSIPKGQSKIYNSKKFSIEKNKKHFTEEFRTKK